MTVIALDLDEVTGFILIALILIAYLFLAELYLDNIDLNGHRKVCLRSVVPILVKILLFLIFAGFLEAKE